MPIRTVIARRTVSLHFPHLKIQMPHLKRSNLARKAPHDHLHLPRPASLRLDGSLRQLTIVLPLPPPHIGRRTNVGACRARRGI